MSHFFQFLEAQDTAQLRQIILKESQYYVQLQTAKGPVVKKDTHENWLKNLVQPDKQLKERYWDLVTHSYDGGVAMVSCAYDFYVDQTYSHCGTNIFTLVKTKEGWKIADTVFSVRKDCDESPLGPYPNKK